MDSRQHSYTESGYLVYWTYDGQVRTHGMNTKPAYTGKQLDQVRQLRVRQVGGRVQVWADRTLVIGYHWSFPGLAHIAKRGNAYSWHPQPWSWS